MQEMGPNNALGRNLWRLSAFVVFWGPSFVSMLVLVVLVRVFVLFFLLLFAGLSN